LKRQGKPGKEYKVFYLVESGKFTKFDSKSETTIGQSFD